jgi:hypothetical protein
MMSVTAIIQGAQNWSRSLSNFGPSHMSLGTSRANFSSLKDLLLPSWPAAGVAIPIKNNCQGRAVQGCPHLARSVDAF